MKATLLLAEPAVRASMGESVLFWVLGALAVVCALGVVCASRAVYSAIFLAASMIILAVFYVAQGAVFLGVVQVVVYTGAVMMLFLFVLMLVGVDSADSLVETLRGQRIAAVAVAGGFGLLLIVSIGHVRSSRPADYESASNVTGLAQLLFVRYVWAFELTSALLITAALGAMVLAHRERITARRGQREMSTDRVRSGDRITPLPSPGVYARHNAVDMGARLPDGTDSELSVSRTMRQRTVAEAEASR
ncbi:NADH-quinone oxidoreductase subunit J [Nocardia sp. NPDC050175]|uniref:NADH-quinone oxidoreductase subunit J n=1 Tax=Nocardia sp. NPDC050175 TaxID=3364317 RepID=UPI0037AD719A